MRSLALATLISLIAMQSASAQITRIWQTHRTNDPSKMVVNWTTKQPGDSVVRYGKTDQYGYEVRIDGNTSLHHVEIPLSQNDTTYHYYCSAPS